jgi:DNA-binding MarR family transcriptional regulator
MKVTEIRHFRKLSRQFERVAHAHLKGCCAEVTLAQCLVLLEVDEASLLTVGELATRLRLDDSTLSRTIDGLVRRGLLDRSRDVQDRRVVRVGLTAEGVDVCSAIHKQNDAIYRSVFEQIAPAKRSEVIDNFETLVEAFIASENEALAAGCSPVDDSRKGPSPRGR